MLGPRIGAKVADRSSPPKSRGSRSEGVKVLSSEE
jgi:hypothetical protein